MAPADPTPPARAAPDRALIAPAAPSGSTELLPLQSQAAAIEAQRPPLAGRALLLVASAFVFAAIAWSCLAEIDRLVVGRGRVVAVDPPIVVQPLSTSIVRSIDVRVGQVVARDQRLVALDPTFAEADLASLRARQRSLAAQLERLEAEFAGRAMTVGDDPDDRLQYALFERRRSEFETKDATYASNVARGQAELQTNLAAQRSVRERVRVLEELERMRRELFDRQTGSRVTVLEAQRETILARGDLEGLVGRAREIETALGAQRAEREAFVGGWRRQVADELVATRRELAGVLEQLAKADRLAALSELRAPADGTVLEVANRSIGSVAREAEALVTLMPTGSTLEIEATIDPQDVARLRAGDAARVKIDAFPYQRHGWIDGTLRAVSEDTLRESESAVPKLSYKARVAIDAVTLRDVPSDSRLIPGMTATIEIRIGSRRVVTYFLYPLFRMLDESIREP
ncbi:MAG: HlyD family type I secretion periplasmic adaptor subunit [Alphaproteobacteria bacterium]|nr:HlyD family type I secretion periplasmic adaptor subunit [Alphaproteobacteria bacterium]